MSTLHAGRLPSRRTSRRWTRGGIVRGLLLAVFGAAFAVVVAVAVVKGLWIGIVALAIGVVFVALGLRDWRWSTTALLVFLPYSGILIIAAYPATGPATLIKDFLFVIPAYLGFAGAYILRRRPIAIPGFPLGFALAFTATVLLGLVAPTLPNLVVGLLGAKVWLMYIPMAYVAYHLIRTRQDLDRLLLLLVIAAVIPSVVGVVEGILLGLGHSDAVYNLYGNAAFAATGGFSEVEAGGASIHRVPSTFSFPAQFGLFTIISLSVAYAWWRGVLVKRPSGQWLGLAVLILVALAALLSGIRTTIFAVPAILIVTLVLDGARIKTWILAPVAIALVFIGASAVFGGGVLSLLEGTLTHAISEFNINTVAGVHTAFGHTLLGLGTGVDTGAAQHSLPDFNPYEIVGGLRLESWWIKAMVELGIQGFLAAVALLLAVVVAVLRAHRRLVDPANRAISSAMIATILFVVFFSFKGAALDGDPMNVEFWVFVGIILRLPVLEREAARRKDAQRRAAGGAPRAFERPAVAVEPAPTVVEAR